MAYVCYSNETGVGVVESDPMGYEIPTKVGVLKNQEPTTLMNFGIPLTVRLLLVAVSGAVPDDQQQHALMEIQNRLKDGMDVMDFLDEVELASMGHHVGVSIMFLADEESEPLIYTGFGTGTAVSKVEYENALVMTGEDVYTSLPDMSDDDYEESLFTADHLDEPTSCSWEHDGDRWVVRSA